MGVKVKVRVGRKKVEIEIPGFDSVEELEAHYEDVVRSRIMEKEYDSFEHWLVSETKVDRAIDIPHNEVMAVYREECKRGGGPGGTEPTGERKDAKIYAKRWKKEQRRNAERNGLWNEDK